MGSMTETVQIGVRQTIANAIYNVDADETPVLALIPTGERPNGMTANARKAMVAEITGASQ